MTIDQFLDHLRSIAEQYEWFVDSDGAIRTSIFRNWLGILHQHYLYSPLCVVAKDVAGYDNWKEKDYLLCERLLDLDEVDAVKIKDTVDGLGWSPFYDRRLREEILNIIRRKDGNSAMDDSG